VSLYNEGLDDLNRFIKYRNKQFKPITSDKLKAMIDGPKNKLRRCQEMLNNFGSIDARNLSSVNTIKQSLEESIRQTEEHATL
jgi:hypothetical protein